MGKEKLIFRQIDRELLFVLIGIDTRKVSILVMHERVLVNAESIPPEIPTINDLAGIVILFT